MTRETKIGLLVGLAFIIVIGILLADHLTTSVEPRQAPLAVAGANVRQTVTTIGQPVTTVQVIPPTTVEPSSPIATNSELTRRLPVELSDAPAVVSTEAGPIGGQPQVVLVPPGMQELIARHGSELQMDGTPQDPATTLTPQPNEASSVLVVTGNAQPVAAPVATRIYTAQPGDSVSRIAARALGANTKANRDAIVRANPSLAKNPDIVVVGKSYVIPTGPVPDAVRPAPVFTEDRRSGETWYVVREDDNLWKIAQSQLGSGSAWTQVRDLNRDVLKGRDSVREGMRLRLPPKAVASAAD